MKRVRLAVVALIGMIMLTAAVVAGLRHQKNAPGVQRVPKDQRAPDSVRVRVQVINATRTRGLARRATMLLRDRGFDVVETGTINDERDSTLVIDLSGHPDWANRVARVLGSARVETRTDSSRYLDIAVYLGTTWRPPAVPFYP